MFHCFLITKKNMISGIVVCLLLIISLTFFAAKNEKTVSLNDGVSVPIIMYHSINDKTSRQGEYVVSPKVLESDIKYLTDRGYSFIFVQDLINYVYKGTPLPKKPVILTFDDGYYNNLIYLPPILKKYNGKASIAVVGDFTDRFSERDSHNINYSHLTWDDLKVLSESEYIEISNHTYNMHSTDKRFGCFKMKNETDDEYKKNLTDDVMLLQKKLKENADIDCKVFTYPYGKICFDSVDIIKEMGFLASLSCHEKTNTVTKDKNSLFLLGRFNRPAGISTKNFMKKINIY